MVDLVLINPPLTLKERYGRLSSAGNLLPPLGLANLAAMTRNNGFKTVILDTAALKMNCEEAARAVIKLNPKYVGITAVTISIYQAAKVAEILKRKQQLITIVGGPHISSTPKETMDIFPPFDIGVIGEGEITLVELLNKLRDGGKLHETNGIVYREENQLHFTKSREPIDDLDSLPMPAWDLLPELSKYYRPPINSLNRLPASSLVTSRGCPSKCIFCDRTVFGNSVRKHSAGYVFKMIKYLYHKFGIRDIFFHDDIFIMFRTRLLELCELIISEKLDLSWSCYARVDMVKPDILRTMKKAGCWQIAYGIESGAQEILDILNKEIRLSLIEMALKYTKEAGIRAKGFFMIGNPKETLATIKETMDFACRVELDDFHVTFFTPLPGTEIFKTAEHYGRLNRDWKKMSMWYPIFIPYGLTMKQLKKYHWLFFLRFYLRPKIIFNYLKLIRRPEHLVKLLQGVIVIFKNYFYKDYD